jgi:hypothetical protein
VTLEAFSDFLIEWREKHKNTDTKLDEITQRIAKGDTKFEMLQRDAAECKLKQDSHSTLIRALTTKEAIRDAADAKPPPSYFMATILPIILSVVIPASMLLIYKLVILDTKAEEKIEKPVHHAPTP